MTEQLLAAQLHTGFWLNQVTFNSVKKEEKKKKKEKKKEAKIVKHSVCALQLLVFTFLGSDAWRS